MSTGVPDRRDLEVIVMNLVYVLVVLILLVILLALLGVI